MEEVRKEGVNLIYKDDKISVTGDTFKLEGALPASELTKVYMGSKGRTVATLTIEKLTKEEPTVQPEVKSVRKLTVNALIDELANKGLTEYEIMQTEVEISA